ncbi:MAG: class B sortase [Eubacteriales bacterium]|nr:class B sortase [Eubacteriales bacterium]
MARVLLKILNALMTISAAVVILLFASYSIYALWDNEQIYASADDVQTDMLKRKPKIDPESGGASFEELLAINKDVCAWITLDNTKIDHPVLQGENLLTYINTDVYGEFALAGSIFLDTANDRTFQDSYSLIYGHHMANHKMFGDLDLYENEDFFRENTSGTLILPDRSYKLEIFACLLVASSEDAIFHPGQWLDNIDGLLAFVNSNAKYLREETMRDLQQDEHPQVVGLSTCSSDFTNARTVILARMI